MLNSYWVDAISHQPIYSISSKLIIVSYHAMMYTIFEEWRKQRLCGAPRGAPLLRCSAFSFVLPCAPGVIAKRGPRNPGSTGRRVRHCVSLDHPNGLALRCRSHGSAFEASWRRDRERWQTVAFPTPPSVGDTATEAKESFAVPHFRGWKKVPYIRDDGLSLFS